MSASLLFPLLNLVAWAPAPLPPQQPSPPAAAVDSIFSGLAAPGRPGCAVAASGQGRPLLSRSYGAADLEHDVPISADSVFDAGSISKQFTAAAILMLAEEKKLSLTDDIRTHLPELPDYGHRVTIDHLLNHTSGLRDWSDMAQISGWRLGTRVFWNADAVQLIARQRSLNGRPGDHFEYTGSGYVLAAEIVERVSGKSLADFTAERIFRPLGMEQSRWRTDFRRVVRGRAKAYRRVGDEYLLYMPFGNVVGPDGLLTTVGDLLIWNQALDSGRLGSFVTAELQREAKDNGGRPLGYARGLWIDRREGKREISHGGMTGAYQATLLRYPDQHLSVALLCNGFDITSNDFGRQLADLFLGAKTATASPAQAQPSITLDAAQADRLAGTFVDEATSQLVTIAAVDGALKWNGADLHAIAPDRFRRPDWGDVRFRGSDLAEVTRTDGTRSNFVRVTGPPPSAAELSSLAGSYRSDELLATFDLSVVEGRLRLNNQQNRFSFDMRPIGNDLFHAPGALLRFQRDPTGRGRSFRLGVRRARVAFTRLD